MNISSHGKIASIDQGRRQILKPFDSGIAWITNEQGNLLEFTPAASKISKLELDRIWSKHNLQINKIQENGKTALIDLQFDLNHGLSGLFSCRKIQIEQKANFLFHKVNPQNELLLTNNQLIADEFGIFSWQFHLESNRFFFSPEAARHFFQAENGLMDYEDFYACLSTESLQRFSEAMESAINYGKAFRLELLLELGDQVKWISFSCKATKDHSESVWLTGLIKDLQNEKAEQSRKHQLEQWFNVGLAKLEVKDGEGEIVATWGNHLKGKNIRIEAGKRTSTILDFRNKPKFIILAETGFDHSPAPASANLETDSVPEFTLPAGPPKKQPVLPVETGWIDKSLLPINKLNKEDKCVALTQWLGQSLDVQISALGIFDGSRFEWKAWWKSPNRFALPVKRYDGEWLPELDWLVDVETDNQKYSDRYWWPQDMLPFQISESFGEGWMLLAEPISNKETSVFAIKTNDPEGIKEKTQHVLKSLDLLKDNPVMMKVQTVDDLKAELARKDMLIKEMNHRAKNNLALAASLVKMQAGHSEDVKTNQILKQTQKRLETLASIHELMYLSPDASGTVSIKDYLTQLTKGLLSSFGNPDIKLELHIDDAVFDMKVANTLGLLVNELVSNAFKYAFSDNKPGILKIDFLDKGLTYKLRVSDNGPGMDSSNPNNLSLGHILIDEFVKQLHGTMEIDTSLGTTYLISLKKNSIEA